MPDGDPFSYLILVFVLIFVNAFFAMSEMAVITLNDGKIKRMAAEGDKKAQTIEAITAEPSAFLSTIQVGVTFAGLLSSAVAADTFSEYIVYALRDTAIPAGVVNTASLVLITLLLSFLTLVFGELVPKRIAMRYPEKISFGIAGILKVTGKVFKPFVALLTVTTNGVLRLFGVDPNDNSREVTQEEIRMMIDEGSEDGTIEPSEQEMLHNIFEFGELAVGEVMTHRTEVESVELDSTLDEIIDIAKQSGHSRIPVCDDGLDDIVGLLMVKDLLPLVLAEAPCDDFDVKKYMRQVIFVPETAPASEVFEQFRRQRLQLAVVVDEYGGTAGVVTMEDLLESIVGNIQDEYDNEPEELVQLSGDEYMIDGTADIEDIEEELGISLSDASDEYETLAGYVTDRLRRIPVPGERASIEACGFSFTVMGVEEHRITKIMAKRLPKPEVKEKEQK